MKDPTWLFEPRDPLFLRDGRPFGAFPGARASSLPFPLPSTTAGAVRTASRTGGDGVFRASPEEIEALKRLPVVGPLLVELDEAGAVRQWLPPAPGDAVLMGDSREHGGLCLRWRRPLELPPGASTSLPEGLLAVGVPDADTGKPVGGPAFWQWDVYKSWLIDPRGLDQSAPTAEDLGTDGPTEDLRTHVALDPGTGAAKDGQLFETRSRAFLRQSEDGSLRRFGVAALGPAGLTERLMVVGGERRLSHLRAARQGDGGPWAPPAVPEDVVAAVVASSACRVLLVTPAIFEAGWRPGALLQPFEGCAPRLVAAQVARPQVVSGWDLSGPNGGRPKPARRMVPPGAVYFLALDGAAADVAAWVRGRWMSPISDGEADRLDGFGLCAVGAWDRKREELA